MKLVAVLMLSLVLVASEEIIPKTAERIIVADVLRDFPGVCYASTQCRTFKEGEEWDLKPFCGKSKCIKGSDGRLMEKVQDCGPLAKANPDCSVSPKTNTSLPFPACCPIYECKAGAKLEFIDLNRALP